MKKFKEFYKKHEGAIWLGIGTIGMATTLAGMYYIGRCDGKIASIQSIRKAFDTDMGNVFDSMSIMAESSSNVFATYPGECDSLEYLDKVKEKIVEEAGENFDLVGVLAFLKKKT